MEEIRRIRRRVIEGDRMLEDVKKVQILLKKRRKKKKNAEIKKTIFAQKIRYVFSLYLHFVFGKQYNSQVYVTEVLLMLYLLIIK